VIDEKMTKRAFFFV